MSWTVIVPLKESGARKSRLAQRLDGPARDRLALAMFGHVAATIAATGASVALLSPERAVGWSGAWHRDGYRDDGESLNAALAALRPAGMSRFAVIHADLPFLAADDIASLFAAADESGLAIAPDRHGSGTNAVAIADERPFAFRFGRESLAAFVADAGARHAVVLTPGLMRDVDTPADLDEATAAGAVLPCRALSRPTPHRP